MSQVEELKKTIADRRTRFGPESPQVLEACNELANVRRMRVDLLSDLTQQNSSAGEEK